MKKVAALFLFCLLMLASAVSAQIDVRAEVVSSNDVQTTQPLVVRIAVFDNVTTAPQSATIRIRWNAANLSFVGVSNLPNDASFIAGGVTYGSTQLDGEMGAPVTSGTPANDGDPSLPDYIDVSLIGPATFPATVINPILCYVKFQVTSTGNTGTYQVAASVKDSVTNHFPYIVLSPPGVYTLDGAGDSNLSFTPAVITRVPDWSLVSE